MANINWFNLGKGIRYTVDSGDGWVKYSDRTMECWGRQLTEGSSGRRVQSVTFPQPYSQTPTVTTTYEGASSTGNFYGYLIEGQTNTSGFQYSGYGGLYVNWRAVGYYE